MPIAWTGGGTDFGRSRAATAAPLSCSSWFVVRCKLHDPRGPRTPLADAPLPVLMATVVARRGDTQNASPHRFRRGFHCFSLCVRAYQATVILLLAKRFSSRQGSVSVEFGRYRKSARGSRQDTFRGGSGGFPGRSDAGSRRRRHGRPQGTSATGTVGRRTAVGHADSRMAAGRTRHFRRWRFGGSPFALRHTCMIGARAHRSSGVRGTASRHVDTPARTSRSRDECSAPVRRRRTGAPGRYRVLLAGTDCGMPGATGM